MINDPWIADVYRIKRAVGDGGGIAMLRELSGRAFEALSIVDDAQAHLLKEQRENAKTGR